MRGRVAAGVGIGIGVVALIVVVALLLLTNTDWGRERVRQLALDRIDRAIDGQVEIGRMEGNLLSRVRLIDVAIRDREGRPFLEADTIETRFGLRALLGQRVELSDLRIVGAHVLLNKPPGEAWNYVRIFPVDSAGEQPGAPGWGDWVALDDVTFVDSRVTVRTEWRPPDDLTPAEREAAIRQALAGDTREHVVEVPGGYQNVMEFRELDAELPNVLIAHPDSVGMAFDVAAFSGLVRPFSPPAARVHDLKGEFRLVRDSLLMSGVEAVLPDSRLRGGGVYSLHSGDLLLIAHADPVAFADLRWIEPGLPSEGGGTMLMTLELGSVINRIVLRDMDVAVGDATVAGRLDVTTGDTLRIGDTDLRFARVETRMVEDLLDVEVPRTGELTGRLAVRGVPGALAVDGDVRFDDDAGGSSRVLADGQLGVDPDLRFRQLRLRFQPLQAGLARAVLPSLPLRGTIEGTAVLTGIPSDLELDADLALRDPRHGLSRVRLAGGLDTRDELRLRDMVVRMDPLRLDLLRDELPELPAGAAATGRVVLDGVPSSALRVDGDIVLDDPATGVSGIGATGRIAFDDGPDGPSFRDLRLRFSPLQTDLVRGFVPELPLRGTVEGTATVTGSLASLELEADLSLRDPRHGVSHVVASGGLDTRGELRLRDMVLRMDPLRLDLLRDELPELPAGAAATGRVVLDGVVSRGLHVDGEIALDDPATGVSHIAATGRVGLGDDLAFDDLRVRVDPLRVDLLRPWLPDLPAGGSVVGAVALNGAPAGLLHVDGQLAHHHPTMGVSRVEASGGLRLSEPMEFRGLELKLEPLHMALARAFAPELPLGGTLTGTATLTGSPDGLLAVSGDLVHVEAGERSRVAGTAEVMTGPGGWAAVDVRLQPLSLDVAGRFVPAAGLRGSVAGQLRASGNLSDLRVDADLEAADGGVVRAEGTLDLAGDAPRYDLDVRLRNFDLAAVTWRAPAETDLTGTVVARGRGLEPATMDASVTADLARSGVGDVGADLVRLRLDLRAGLARVDSSVIRLDGAEAVLDGSFGLVAGRDGTLSYRVAIDSLHAFAAWLPGADTAVTPTPPALAPDPALDLPTPVADIADSGERDPALDDLALADTTVSDPTAAGMADATSGDEPVRRYRAADGARVVETTTLVQTGIERTDTETARSPVAMAILGDTAAAADSAAMGVGAADAATGIAAGVDSLPPVPAGPPSDSLAGSLRAAGTLRGNVTRFDMDGRASVDDLLYRRAYVGSGDAEYALADVGTELPDIRIDAELHEVRTSEVALDSLSVRGRYRGLRGEGAGEAVLAAHGTNGAEYRADADFTFSPAESELRFANLMLRFDTVTWSLAQPGEVSWANDAIRVAEIDLRSDAGGRVRLDGRLPVDGTGDLDLVIENLEIAQVVGLLQRDETAAGRLSVEANVQGTLAAPRVSGTARLEDALLNGRQIPNARATLQYEGRELIADATLVHEGRVLATADVTLPVDLSLRPDFAPRLLPGPLAIDFHADSLPIEAIPQLSEQVREARGRMRGDIAVRGTVDDPVVTGEVGLDFGSVYLVPLALRLEEVTGSLTLDGDRLLVDSLVARSGGPIRVTGELGMASLTDPTFALEIETRETLVIDTEDASLRVDADLVVGGSLASIEVDGEVRTRRGVIYIPRLSEMGETEVVSLHSPATSERIEEEFLRELRLPGQRRPLLERLDLDLRLQIDRDVWLRSTEANIEIYTPRDVGPLHIRVDPASARLALDGTVNTDRGEYEFMSRRFEMTRGAATFVADPEINPILQIAAEHQVRLPGREAFDIRVLLGGTLRNPEITLESNAQPPIAQTDLLSYLAFGRDAATLIFREGSTLSAQGGDAGELVGNVAGLATQQLGTVAIDALVNDLEAELMRDLHVDVFRITPADLPPDMFTGGYVDLLRSTELDAGRYISSRFFVAAQVTTGGSRPGVRVEYAAPFGLQWLTTWRSRWMPTQPTLTEQTPRRAGVFGSFLLREWRF